MGSAEDPTWLQLLQKDPSPPGPQPTALSCPQDGSSGAGVPAMRDCCPSQQKASPAPSRHTPDQDSGMDSRHSSPSVTGEGASCSDGPGGSLACPTSTCIFPQEVITKRTLEIHEASVSGTSETTFSGKPGISKAEPMSSVKTDPTSSENRSLMFLEEMDSKSSKVDFTSTAKDDARSSSKAESMAIKHIEPAILGKGDPVSSGKVDPESLGKEGPMSSSTGNTVSPTKEDPGSLRKRDPVSSGKVESASPRKEDPRCSGKEHLVSSEKLGPVSSGKADHGPSGKVVPMSLESMGSASVGKADPGSFGKVTAGSPGKTEIVSSGIVQPGTSGREIPTSKGSVETMSVFSTEEDPKSLEKRDPASLGKGDPGSVRMMKTVSAGQVDPVFSGAMDPTSLKNVEPITSGQVGSICLEKVSLMSSEKPLSPGQAEPVPMGKTETTSLGEETPVSSRSVDLISVGNIKPCSGKVDLESTGKIDPILSDLGGYQSMATAGLSSSVKAEVLSGEKVGPMSLEKADPLASGKAEPLTLDKVDPAKTRKDAQAGLSGEADSVSPGKKVLTSLGKVDPMSPRKAETAPERNVELPPPEKGNPVNSGKVDPNASGNREPTVTPESKVAKPPEKEGPASSGKNEAVSLQKEKLVASADVSSSGKADSVGSGKASSVASPKTAEPLVGKVMAPPEKAEVLFRQSDDKSRGTAPAPGGVGDGGSLAEPEPLPCTEVSSLSPKDLPAPGAKSPGLGATVAPAGPRTRDNFTKAPSWEASSLPPPREDAGTQAGAQACVSVAVSPMSPQDGAGGPAFSFQAAPKAPSPVARPPSRRDAGLQVSLGAAETRSVATGPMTPQAAVPPVFPEVRVKPGSALAAAVAPQETAEPVRDVSWDEKGMTWEVYGASMEVEVLGMAIQKHLERQIEEHGRQGAPAPTSTGRSGPGRSGSVRAAPPEGTAKRPPGLFRALLQSVRRPRCCSRAGPTAE